MRFSATAQFPTIASHRQAGRVILSPMVRTPSAFAPKAGTLAFAGSGNIMTGRSELELSEAIQESVQQCVGDPDPPGCVRAYCEMLISSRQWSSADAQAVEEAALRVIENLRSVSF
jgi:hypothetical protein